MDIKELNEKLQSYINEEESYEGKLQQVADEVKSKIKEIYGNDDLMEYFVVEPKIGKYDDGNTKYSIEVRGELGYEAMTDLALKLDEIVQQYDRYAYFDQVDGGIMAAAMEFDKQPYEAPYQITIEAIGSEPDTLYYDDLKEAENICNQILNGSKRDEITKLVIEELKDGEYIPLKVFKAAVQESLNGYKEIGKILQNKENGGFNVAEGNDPMLIKDQPTLKELLEQLAKYL